MFFFIFLGFVATVLETAVYGISSSQMFYIPIFSPSLWVFMVHVAYDFDPGASFLG